MKEKEKFKSIIEGEVSKARFNMDSLYKRVLRVLKTNDEYQDVAKANDALDEGTGEYVLKGILRASFLIELVKTPKIETTKFEHRWTSRLNPSDPRHASFEECLKIFNQVWSGLGEILSDRSNVELLQKLNARHLLAYEIPLDYKDRKIESPMHRSKNIFWILDDIPKRVVQLRSFLLDKKGNKYYPLFVIVYDKIKVKTYLTDRVLTGPNKTNREKRWETHPASVHFALRCMCMEIEYYLVNQLCHFEGFPSDLKKKLDHANVLEPLEKPFRCPITMEPLFFQEFEKEIKDPKHGKARFQIGHLNPLKTGKSFDPTSGHTAKNMSWISDDGNRIQGSLSLEEIRALIHTIYSNYKKYGVKIH